jgi:hypothetical protein
MNQGKKINMISLFEDDEGRMKRTFVSSSETWGSKRTSPGGTWRDDGPQVVKARTKAEIKALLDFGRLTR